MKKHNQILDYLLVVLAQFHSESKIHALQFRNVGSEKYVKVEFGSESDRDEALLVWKASTGKTPVKGKPEYGISIHIFGYHCPTLK